MANNIFENLTDEERDKLWMYMIFNKDKIKERTEQLTKEAEEAGMTLTEYLESISPLALEKEDCISRQAVIDAFWKLDIELKPNAINAILNMINNIPPVNPIKTVTNAKEAEEYQVRPSDDKKSCDNCKHYTESWDSDACDGCCRANSKWSGEIYPGEFEAMEHNGRMDALESEEQT